MGGARLEERILRGWRMPVAWVLMGLVTRTIYIDYRGLVRIIVLPAEFAASIIHPGPVSRHK